MFPSPRQAFLVQSSVLFVRGLSLVPSIGARTKPVSPFSPPAGSTTCGRATSSSCSRPRSQLFFYAVFFRPFTVRIDFFQHQDHRPTPDLLLNVFFSSKFGLRRILESRRRNTRSCIGVTPQVYVAAFVGDAFRQVSSATPNPRSSPPRNNCPRGAVRSVLVC